MLRISLAGPAGPRADLLAVEEPLDLTTSACGVCGKDSVESIRVRSRYDITADPVQVSPDVLATRAPHRLTPVPAPA